MGNNGTEEDKKLAVIDKPHPAEDIVMQTAKDAYNVVLDKTGCNLPSRDTLDQRIVNDVKKRTGRFIDVQGAIPMEQIMK